MKTPHLNDVLEVLEPGTHPAHGRHRARAHHWSATVLVLMVSVGLVVLLVIASRQTAAPSFKVPGQPISTEAATTATGVASDFSQINTSNLGDNQLAPVTTNSSSAPKL